MKRLSIVSAVLIVLLSICIVSNAEAQENETPLLLKQQNPLQQPLPPAPGQVPFTTVPPTAPPLPPPGIPVVQTIPTETLLANLAQAVITAQKLNKLIEPGKVWVMRAPAGESEIKGGLLYQGVAVAVLRFNPLDGSVLPLGVNPHEYRSNVKLLTIKTNLSSATGSLRILPEAEFMEPEACWSFPVVLGNTIVAHIKVYYDGIHVLQDYAANQEMTFYGQ